MKKGILAIIAAMFFCFVFTGCGGEKQTPAAKPSQPAQPAPAAKEVSVGDLLGKGKNISGLTYDYVLSAKEMQLTGKFWASGKKIKFETTVANQKVITIIDGSASVMYNYLPDQKLATKMALDPAKIPAMPDKYSKEVDPAKFKVLESTTYEGVKCKVLLLEDAGNATQKLWVREDYGMPMRVEMTSASGDKQVMEFKNMKVEAVPDSVFALPEGVPVTDLGAMMKNMPVKS